MANAGRRIGNGMVRRVSAAKGILIVQEHLPISALRQTPPAASKPRKGTNGAERLPTWQGSALRTPEGLSVWLPLPDMRLSPNGRGNWQMRNRLTKAARALAAVATRPAWRGQAITAATYRIVMWRQKRIDDDNAVAVCKSYVDGISDIVAPGKDGRGKDGGFRFESIEQHTGKASLGRREVLIELRF